MKRLVTFLLSTLCAGSLALAQPGGIVGETAEIGQGIQTQIAGAALWLPARPEDGVAADQATTGSIKLSWALSEATEVWLRLDAVGEAPGDISPGVYTGGGKRQVYRSEERHLAAAVGLEGVRYQVGEGDLPEFSALEGGLEVWAVVSYDGLGEIVPYAGPWTAWTLTQDDTLEATGLGVFGGIQWALPWTERGSLYVEGKLSGAAATLGAALEYGW